MHSSRIILLLLLLTQLHTQIKIKLNSESATALLSIMEKKAINQAELDRLIGLGGIKAMISQTARFDKQATAERFRQDITTLLKGNPAGDDPFRLQQVYDRLSDIKQLLNRIEENPQQLSDEIIAMIAAYSPANLDLDVTVFLTLGGSSDGWTLENYFNIALQFFGDDYDGLKILMAHELYHLVQEKLIKDPDSKRPHYQAKRLIYQTLIEGTASLVGDPLKATDGKNYTNWFARKYQRNLARIADNFALFELMFYRLYSDPDSKLDDIYNLGFSGNWDSALYFVGYYIAKVIYDQRGKEEFLKLCADGPVKLFRTYIDIYKSQTKPEFQPFSTVTENQIKSLSE
ncbi:MAG: hypothetical protein KDD94_08410 [Calditrichaeota bacterium]|nr:hypothetical protein [Calditrichota bacterium]